MQPRPRLDRVRWRLDGPTREHALVAVYEFGGVFSLNPQAALVLSLCDGDHDASQIVAEVVRKYDIDSRTVEGDVTNLLALWEQLRVIRYAAAEGPCVDARA